MSKYKIDCIVCGDTPNRSQVTVDGDTISREIFFCKSHREVDIVDFDNAIKACRPSDLRLREE